MTPNYVCGDYNATHKKNNIDINTKTSTIPNFKKRKFQEYTSKLLEISIDILLFEHNTNLSQMQYIALSTINRIYDLYVYYDLLNTTANTTYQSCYIPLNQRSNQQQTTPATSSLFNTSQSNIQLNNLDTSCECLLETSTTTNNENSSLSPRTRHKTKNLKTTVTEKLSGFLRKFSKDTHSPEPRKNSTNIQQATNNSTNNINNTLSSLSTGGTTIDTKLATTPQQKAKLINLRLNDQTLKETINDDNYSIHKEEELSASTHEFINELLIGNEANKQQDEQQDQNNFDELTEAQIELFTFEMIANKLEPKFLLNLIQSRLETHKKELNNRVKCVPSIRTIQCSNHCSAVLASRLLSLLFNLSNSFQTKFLNDNTLLNVIIDLLNPNNDPHLLCLLLQSLGHLAINPLNHDTLLKYSDLPDTLMSLVLPSDDLYYTNQTTKFAKYVKHLATRVLVYLGLFDKVSNKCNLFDILIIQPDNLNGDSVGNSANAAQSFENNFIHYMAIGDHQVNSQIWLNTQAISVEKLIDNLLREIKKGNSKRIQFGFNNQNDNLLFNLSYLCSCVHPLIIIRLLEHCLFAPLLRRTSNANKKHAQALLKCNKKLESMTSNHAKKHLSPSTSFPIKMDLKETSSRKYSVLNNTSHYQLNNDNHDTIDEEFKEEESIKFIEDGASNCLSTEPSENFKQKPKTYIIPQSVSNYVSLGNNNSSSSRSQSICQSASFTKIKQQQPVESQLKSTNLLNQIGKKILKRGLTQQQMIIPIEEKDDKENKTEELKKLEKKLINLPSFSLPNEVNSALSGLDLAHKDCDLQTQIKIEIPLEGECHSKEFPRIVITNGSIEHQTSSSCLNSSFITNQDQSSPQHQHHKSMSMMNIDKNSSLKSASSSTQLFPISSSEWTSTPNVNYLQVNSNLNIKKSDGSHTTIAKSLVPSPKTISPNTSLNNFSCTINRQPSNDTKKAKSEEPPDTKQMVQGNVNTNSKGLGSEVLQLLSLWIRNSPNDLMDSKILNELKEFFNQLDSLKSSFRPWTNKLRRILKLNEYNVSFDMNDDLFKASSKNLNSDLINGEYNELMNSILDNKVPCSIDECTTLAAIQLRINELEFKKDSYYSLNKTTSTNSSSNCLNPRRLLCVSKHNKKLNYILPSNYYKKSTKSILKLVESKKDKLSKTSYFNDLLKLKEFYVKLCKQLNAYDAILFNIKAIELKCSTQHLKVEHQLLVNKCILAIKSNKLLMLDFKTKTLLKQEKISDLVNWYSGVNMLRAANTLSTTIPLDELINNKKTKKMLDINRLLIIIFRTKISSYWLLQIDNQSFMKSIQCLLLDYTLNLGIDNNLFSFDYTLKQHIAQFSSKINSPQKQQNASKTSRFNIFKKTRLATTKETNDPPSITIDPSSVASSVDTSLNPHIIIQDDPYSCTSAYSYTTKTQNDESYLRITNPNAKKSYSSITCVSTASNTYQLLYNKELTYYEQLLPYYPEEVAYLLTDVEYELFNNVKPIEYLRHIVLDYTSFMTQDYQHNCVPHKTIQDLIQRYKEVSSWIKNLIQSQDNDLKRSNLIMSCIRCAITCWNIGNFNSAREIWLGLKTTLVNQIDDNIQEMNFLNLAFDSLNAFKKINNNNNDQTTHNQNNTNNSTNYQDSNKTINNDTARNYLNKTEIYCESLSKALDMPTCKVIPFFGAFLNDLRHLFDNVQSLSIICNKNIQKPIEVCLIRTCISFFEF